MPRSNTDALQSTTSPLKEEGNRILPYYFPGIRESEGQMSYLKRMTDEDDELDGSGQRIRREE